MNYFSSCAGSSKDARSGCESYDSINSGRKEDYLFEKIMEGRKKDQTMHLEAALRRIIEI